ncbi:MAG: hypothetical protein K8T91_18210 [Planctomycetes bacterium]|nr:hypothetical protein [Planctomycetota bacterium]
MTMNNIPAELWLICHESEVMLTQWCGLSAEAAWSLATNGDSEVRERMESLGYRAVRYAQAEKM